MPKRNISKTLLMVDLLCWLCSVLIVTFGRTILSKYIIFAYILASLVLAAVWCAVGFLVHKYESPQQRKPWKVVVSHLHTIAIVFALSVLAFFIPIDLSYNVLAFIIGLTSLFDLAYLFGYFSIRYATSADIVYPVYCERVPQKPLFEGRTLPYDKLKVIQRSIEEQTSAEVLDWLMLHTPLNNSNTLVQSTSDVFNVRSLVEYRYSCFINLKVLNDVLGLNELFCAVNTKLPDNGLYVCCFTPQSEQKRQILEKYPKGLNYIIYSFNFFFKRFLPKILLTNRVYFSVTKGKRRVFSTTEILGRLYYCGFEVIEEQQFGNQVYVVARRKRIPDPQTHKVYGPLITLNRIGKDGKKFKVYKMRTMHPYSEYLQSYMMDKYGLQEGGKFANDIRVITMGKFMRKCWLDELPMFINFFRGEMKLVGVRPLSQQYFNLYSKELQEKRTKFRPGLLPPFYADMPKTLEEIQASEMRYLIQCEKRGCFLTDTKYIFLIFKNIVFKRARSH